MSELAICGEAIPATEGAALEKVNQAEARMRALYAEHAAPDTTVTEHLLHGGMYARTVRVKAPQAFCSVMVRPPTILIVHGAAQIYAGAAVYAVRGYQVMPASAGRKAIWVIEEDTEITAIFPCQAKSREAAEQAFTAEVEKLPALNQRDVVIITEVEACQA